MSKTEIPYIRFRGFDDAWEQRKLGDIADIVGGGTPSTGNQSYWDGDIDWYAPAEIADQIYANSSQKKITGLGYENSSAKMLPPGTVLFTSRAGIGKTAILTRKGCTNQGFQSIVPHRGELDSYFIFSRTEELKRYGELVGAGSTFVEVSGKQMAVMELMVPPTMREQQTIGGFFQQLDQLITLHQRKFEKLTNVKKSMLEKMFPQNGSCYPETRFNGFTDPWEQRKVGELIEDYIEKTTVQNQYPVLTSSQQQGVVFQEDYFADRQVTTNDNIGYYVLPYGYLTYRSRSDTDVFVFNRNNIIDRGIISYYYPVFLPKDCDSNFLLRRLNHGIKKQLSMAAEGTGQKVLAHNKFKNMVVDVPEIEEQQKIGLYFESLDHLITLHQRELEKLQSIKKSLLEKMFV